MLLSDVVAVQPAYQDISQEIDFPGLRSPRLGITVCTRGRPKMIQACLESLCRELNDQDINAFIVVIENEDTPSLNQMIKSLRLDFPGVELVYGNEPTVGIPFARNRAIDIALDNHADWLAFIDDDEEVEPGWLHAMYHAIQDLKADALTGPVRTIFPSQAPTWWKKPELGRWRHGDTLASAATNNTFLKSRWLKGPGKLRFNTDLRYSGGEDTELFYRLTDMGGTIKWVDDAIVSETLPHIRTTMSWHLKRKIRTEANSARNYRDRKGLRATVAKFLPTLFLRSVSFGPLLVLGWLCRPFSKFHSDRLVFSSLKSGAAALGAALGLVGRRLEPYRRIDGY